MIKDKFICPDQQHSDFYALFWLAIITKFKFITKCSVLCLILNLNERVSINFLNLLLSLTCKVSEQFVHSEDLQYLHQSDHLASPANDMVILQSLQNERDVKWEQGPQVYEVHGFFQKLKFVWTADESHNKFNCEEDKSWDINNLNFNPG